MPREDDAMLGRRELEARVASLEATLRDKEQVEAHLRESEARLALVLEGTNDGWWDWRLATDEMYYSPRWWEIVGYVPGELPATRETWTRLSHPEDTERVNQVYTAALERGADHFEVESRRRHKDGHWVPVLTRGRITRDSGGKPVRISGTTTDLTQPKQAEQALRRSEELFRSMVETTLVGVWAIDGDGRTTFVNARMAEMLGYEPGEMLGHSAQGFLLDEDVAAHRESMARRHAGRRETYERRFRRKDGAVIWAIVSATPLMTEAGEFGGSFATLTDITGRKRDEERLRTLAAMLDAAPNSITVHDREGRFLYANQRTFQLHGYAEAPFMAMNLRDVDVPGSADRIDERMRIIAEEGEARFEVEHIRSDGSTFPLEVYVRQTVWDGKPVLLSVATDITERRRVETALERQVEELRRWYAVTLGREKRIGELKDEVNSLAGRLGLPLPYAETFDEGGARTT